MRSGADGREDMNDDRPRVRHLIWELDEAAESEFRRSRRFKKKEMTAMQKNSSNEANEKKPRKTRSDKGKKKGKNPSLKPSPEGKG